MDLKNDFSEGDVFYAGQTTDNFALNGITNEINIGSVPIGSYFAMLSLGSGTVTSVTEDKLVDSGASFTSSWLGKTAYLNNYYDGTTYTAYGGDSTGNQLKKTWTFDASEAKGVTIVKITNSIRGSDRSYQIGCYYTLYYTDSTSANTNTVIDSGTAWKAKTYTNPHPTKYVWKVELYLRQAGSSDHTQAAYHNFYLSGSAVVTAVDSGTTLSIDRDLFIMTGLGYSFYNFANGKYEPCDGTAVAESNSPLFGLTKPIAENNFIRVI